MTFDWKHILLAVVIGITAGSLIFVKCSDSKKLDIAVKEKHDSSTLYWALRHSMDHLIIIHATDSTYWDSVVTHQPKPTHYTLYIHDTVEKDQPLCESSYTDSIVKDRFHVTYDLNIINCNLKNIRFRKMTYPVDTVRMAAIFKDTCLPHPATKSLWDWEVTPRVAYNPFHNSFEVSGNGAVFYWNIGFFTEIGATTKKDAEFKIGLLYKFHKK